MGHSRLYTALSFSGVLLPSRSVGNGQRPITRHNSPVGHTRWQRIVRGLETSDPSWGRFKRRRLVGIKGLLAREQREKHSQGLGNWILPTCCYWIARDGHSRGSLWNRVCGWSFLCRSSSLGLKISMYQLVSLRALIWYIICLYLRSFAKSYIFQNKLWKMSV